MSYLLRIDTSPRIEASSSRRLSDVVQAHIMTAHDLTSIVTRDLTTHNLPHIQQDTITGFYTPEPQMTPELAKATELSDLLISELKGASVILISAPIYNFSTPSALKAWIDQVVRIGHTFSYDGENFGGLVPASHAYLALSYGSTGYEVGGPMRGLNFLEPYLTSLFEFLGIETVKAFNVQSTTAEEPIALRAYTEALQAITSHFSS